jgi:hypothetical protein
MNDVAHDDDVDERAPIYATPPNGLRESPDQRAKRLRTGVERVLSEASGAAPQAPAIGEPRARTGGRQRGTPSKPKPDPFDVDALRKPPQPPACRLCGEDTTLLSPELTREMLRSARDQLVDFEPEVRGRLAESSLLYVAARLDGFCSLACWRKAQEP